MLLVLDLAIDQENLLNHRLTFRKCLQEELKELCKLGTYKARVVCALKGKVRKKNPHTTEELRNNIHREPSTIGRRKERE
jgi:hypothetical protein